MLKIAHIINPVRVGESSDLSVAQPVTFETMKRARDFCSDEVQVDLYSAQYQEDRGFAPDYFEQTDDLTRSVCDVGGFQSQKKLPLIKDILDRLYDATDADYMIYTNVDIALQPYFYSAVLNFIKSGLDAFAINRRTIPSVFKRLEMIPMMYTQIGESHPGHDCFIFRRDAYQHFMLEDTCIGARDICRPMLTNMCKFTKTFAIINNTHLTFHIGDDRTWDDGAGAPFHMHNKNQLIKICRELCDPSLLPVIDQGGDAYVEYMMNLKRAGRL